MKTVQMLIVFSLLNIISFSLSAQDKNTDVTKKEPVIDYYKLLTKKKYTTKQIESLKKSAEYRKATYTYSSYAYVPYSSGDKKKREKLQKKYKKNKKTPFRIVVQVYERKESKKQKAYYKGSADIYIVDMENKKIIESKRVSLSKLCPS